MGFTIVEVHDDPAAPGAEKRGAGVKPIVFTDHSIEAIEAGRKTMTRRVVKGLDGMNVYRVEPHWSYDEDEPLNGVAWDFVFGACGGGMCFDGAIPIKPRYLKGDLLWVKETWKANASDLDVPYVYRRDGIERWPNNLIKWSSPWFMPKAAARVFLMVEDVRPERVQEISEADALAEGIRACDDGCFEGNGWSPTYSDPDSGGEPVFRNGFGVLWDGINGKREGGRYAWAKNPWVWAYRFRRADKPEGWMAA